MTQLDGDRYYNCRLKGKVIDGRKLFQRIKELTELQGISGYERNVLEYLIEK